MEKSMHSISNYDNYRVVQQNHDTAKNCRNMERDRRLFRTARAIEISLTLATVLCVLAMLARLDS